MRARLFSRVGETRGAELEFTGEVILGRHPECSLVLGPSLISSRHARLRHDGEAGCWVLEDLGSLNGTQVDGHRVTGSERLGHLHVITLAGQHDFIFQDLERCARRHGAAPSESVTPPQPAAGPRPPSPEIEPPPVERTSIEELPVVLPGFLAGPRHPGRVDAAGAVDDRTLAEKLPVAIPEVLAGKAEDVPTGKTYQPPETVGLDPDTDLPPLGDVTLAETSSEPPKEAPPPRVFLEFVGAGDEAGRRVRLVEGENVLGRGADARIQPDSLDISRHHALLTVAGETVTVRDLGSRNRTFVNDEEVDGEVRLEPGARLRFGSVEAELIVLSGDER